ncbi:MAG: GIY-YIG nuclease family protein [bacterium]|nr:GIY-YIG nuclease family protein [bacterium]
MNSYYVYMMASDRNGTLYIGVTSNLIGRAFEHKNGAYGGFTAKYKVDKLVYFEETTSIEEAITKEKQLKKWNRQWKMRLIEDFNPKWEDLSYNIA